MRYHYEPPANYTNKHGRTYTCKHPVYDKCTLYEKGFKGLAIVQQRFDPVNKTTKWTELDPWLVDDIFSRPGFQSYFEQMADEPKKGLYPTVTARQVMWSLRMKPLDKPMWETVFDRRQI